MGFPKLREWESERLKLGSKDISLSPHALHCFPVTGVRVTGYCISQPELTERQTQQDIWGATRRGLSGGFSSFKYRLSHLRPIMTSSRGPAIGGRVAAGGAQPKSTDPSAKDVALRCGRLLICFGVPSQKSLGS